MQLLQLRMGLSDEVCSVGASWNGLGWIVFTGCVMGGLLVFPSEDTLNSIGLIQFTWRNYENGRNWLATGRMGRTNQTDRMV